MRKENIDRDRLRAALKLLPNHEVYYMLGEALEMLPLKKLEKLVKRYLNMSQLRSEIQSTKSLLDEVKAFEQASLRGDYYESFDVNSKNCSELSNGTRSWILQFNRLLDRCVAAVKMGSKIEIRTALESCFGLLRHIDECLDDVIFFADEGGSWQVGVDWNKVLPAYFACLSETAPPEEYAARVVELIDEFQDYVRDRHLPKVKRIGSPAQRQALRSLLSGGKPAKKARVL